jgi:D-lactate dehydrogenase (quinone)
VDPPLDTLARELRGVVRTSPEALARANRDASHVVGRAAAVVAPKDPEDVVALVRWARTHRVPLVARGGGTSLDGESVPVRGGVVVDFGGWNRILQVRVEDGWARVEPGVVNRDLQVALEPHGRFFPPNPGSWTTSTVGGHVGTNASGPRSFRYGATRAWVRQLDAVLGTGERVRWGSLAAKRSVGPDLLGLFVGSEGTLGIATEVTVRLAVRPEVRLGLVIPLAAQVSLGRLAVALSGASPAGLSAVEYLDGDCARELSGTDGFERTADGPLLLLEVEADSVADSRRRSELLRSVLRGVGVTEEPRVYEDADALWTLRGRASVELDRKVGERIREDVAVPLSQVDRLLREVRVIAAREHVPLYLFGHLGEGSLHPNFVVDPGGARAARVRTALVRASLRLGGTVSAEHGVGALKARYLEAELGRPGVELLREVKRSCDPAGILNPGKLYPLDARPAARGSSRSPSAAAAGRSRSGSPSGAAGRRGTRARFRARDRPRRRAARP